MTIKDTALLEEIIPHRTIIERCLKASKDKPQAKRELITTKIKISYARTMPLKGWTAKLYNKYSLIIMVEFMGVNHKVLRTMEESMEDYNRSLGPKFESNSRQNETCVEVKIDELEGLHHTCCNWKRDRV